MSEAPKEYQYRPKMAHEKTHADCYFYKDIYGIPCEGDMILFPKHPSGRMAQRYCCQGHAYISWADLSDADRYYNFKRVYRTVFE